MPLGGRGELRRDLCRDAAQIDCSLCRLSASASSRERSRRSVESFVSRSIWPAHRPHELAPRLGIGLGLVIEQLDEPAERGDRRPQLVGGVGDEVAAGRLEPAEAPLHLSSVSASWPSSSLEPTGIGTLKSPCGDPLGRLLEPAMRRAW